MIDEEYRMKTQLLGELKPRSAGGAFQPNRSDLVKPLEGPNSFMPAFCQGCGLVFELTTKGKQVFQSEFSLTMPHDPAGYYLHVGRCIHFGCDTKYRDPEIRRIPEL